MEYNQVFNISEFDPLFPQEIGGSSDQDWWDPSCLFDGNTVAQPLPPVLDTPPATNQEDYFLTDQEWWQIYDATMEPRFDAPPTDHLLADHGNTVQPPPSQPAHNSEFSIPTTTQGEYSMTDQQWCDFRLGEAIDGCDELECAFIDLLERMAATIRKICSTAPASPESEEAEATAKPIKKRNRWSEGEHKLFLEGVKVYRHGAWTKIARHYVKTRTNIQIASHAQKHYLRQSLNGSGITKKKKKSIHQVPDPN